MGTVEEQATFTRRVLSTKKSFQISDRRCMCRFRVGLGLNTCQVLMDPASSLLVSSLWKGDARASPKIELLINDTIVGVSSRGC